MSASLPDRSEITAVLELAAQGAGAYLEQLDESPVRLSRAEAAARSFRRPLPETGDGAVAALRELLEGARGAVLATSGPRCFHLIVGGVTPAALGADWLTTVFDNIAYAWVISPLAVELERLSLAWLRELFELPSEWGGIFTSGATMANFVGLACARQWWGEQQGVDPSQTGLSGLPPVPVLSSGYIHASAVKTLGMLGIGRGSLRKFTRDAVGRLDLDALEQALRELKGAPAILVANAGEVNAGDFDPLERMADLAKRYGAWLHVDGAFGLFARCTAEARHLVAGVERADSVTVDGHKWLNVPYDCGFSFVRDPALMLRAFVYDAAYLPDHDPERPVMGSMGPESSRRARSFAVWSTLRAYGRAGVRHVVEEHLALARHMGERIEATPEFELMAPVQLNICCFRFAPAGHDDRALDALNQRLGEAILEDGRFYVGTSLYGGRTVLRPAISNWRIRREDVDGFVDHVRELAQALSSP